MIRNKPTTTIVKEIVEDTAHTSTIESSSFVDVELSSTACIKKYDDGDDIDDDVDVDGDNCDIDYIDKTDDIEVDDDNGNDDLDDTTTMTTSLRLDHNQEKQQQLGIKYNGTCIIYLEEFVTDDAIVWSADPSCSHTYHKTCMVQYLASNAKNTSKQTRLSYDLIRIPVFDVINNPSLSKLSSSKIFVVFVMNISFSIIVKRLCQIIKITTPRDSMMARLNTYNFRTFTIYKTKNSG